MDSKEQEEKRDQFHKDRYMNYTDTNLLEIPGELLKKIKLPQSQITIGENELIIDSKRIPCKQSHYM